jgi:hypothetical protein
MGGYGDLILFGAYAIGGMWLLLGLARLQATWEQSQSRTATLRFALQNHARQLMGKIAEVKRLENEIATAKRNVDVAKSEQKESTDLLGGPPPMPEELLVVAEFPSSKKEVAWVAEFVRLPNAPERLPSDREPEPMVFWAHNHTAAGARARQLIAEFKVYDLNSLRRLEA